MWKSNFCQIFLDFWLVSTGFPRYTRQLMWFQHISSVDVGGRCLYGAFAMHALAGCKLLSGCLKCCGTSSVKWRLFLIGAVLALSSTVLLLKCCSSLPLWVFGFSWTSWSAVLNLTFWDYYKLFVFTSSDAATPLLGVQGEETEASKWAMGLAPPRVL